ncbi:hypothetical protein B4U79_10313 [Dinothrombium tinctorium]|uniref:AAA+ ATPase domain-containing protein n=1 Tax=Dinothrombium tinctorium TaxID=1965070 RepID=A0A3S3S3Z1_9ACAR|nr:hypothetical protein B4U79_15774 [Dinothrombium tinctorium]RWS08826.1 hypothetical protein B4U79_05210 [Dinothrombium tinctorium]RWS13616.1 hypothetical protein B4U79_10313 [Dinothrombium tinctorium]
MCLNKDDWVKIWLKGNEQHWRWAKVSSEKSKDIPTFAKGVHISLIQSPDYTGDIDFSLILKTYFGQPRIVMKGDVIAIHSKFDLLFYNKAKEEIRDTWPLIFFKVSRIEGDGCLLDTENSKLYQTGTTKYFVPLSMYNYYFENEASIDFLHRHIERLSNLVTPYLSLLKKVVTLLLSGPQGSGKTYIVKSLCKLWNLHLYEVDCNSILCDTPSATEAKLKVVFDKITRYAPCIVLFSYFELMCRESNGNDPRVFECFRKCLQETCDELPIIIIIETADPDIILNSEFGILFTHHFSIDYLNEIERLEILQLLLGQRILSGCLDIFDLVKRTSGFVFDDLNILVKKAINASYRRISSQTQAQLNELDVALSGVVITKDDFSVALADLHKAYNQAIDSIAPNRGKSGDSGGVMDRVVSQLLAEIDGINKNNQVFIIGATNRPDLLDPALLRPGRFDRLVYVGVAEDVDSRLKILQALTRNFQLHEDCDLSLIEEKCPQLLTGADFYSLCSSAMISAIERSVLQLEKGKADEESTEIEVRYEDFVNSISSLKPSISEKEMKKYKNIKESLNSTQLK